MHSRSSVRFVVIVVALATAHSARAASASAYVRVNQAGYESANSPFQAYLMSTTSEPRRPAGTSVPSPGLAPGDDCPADLQPIVVDRTALSL